MIILIFGKQQEIWEVELDWRDTFPARRLRREPVWHEQNASRPPPGAGKQLCHSIAAQSNQAEKRPTDCRHTEPNSLVQLRSKHTKAGCPNPHCCSPSDSTRRAGVLKRSHKHRPLWINHKNTHIEMWHLGSYSLFFFVLFRIHWHIYELWSNTSCQFAQLRIERFFSKGNTIQFSRSGNY